MHLEFALGVYVFDEFLVVGDLRVPLGYVEVSEVVAQGDEYH